MARKTLFGLGVVSSVLYVAIDLIAAIAQPGYHSFTSQAISELGAIGSPTKALVDPLFIVYDVLLIWFGAGVWMSAGGKRALQVIALALIGIGAVGLPAPWLYSMNVRGSAPVSEDVPHIVATGVIVVCIMMAMVAGFFALGRRFRLFSIATLLTTIVAGTWTSLEASSLAAGQGTPWMGLAERIDVGTYLLWVAVLAVALWRRGETSAETSARAGGPLPTAAAPPAHA